MAKVAAVRSSQVPAGFKFMSHFLFFPSLFWFLLSISCLPIGYWNVFFFRILCVFMHSVFECVFLCSLLGGDVSDYCNT